jgi:hypothetical protein
MLVQGGLYLFRSARKYFAPYHDDQVACRQPMLRFAEAFAKQSFQLVALYRLGYLFTRYRKSEARSIAGFFTDQNRDAGVSTSKIVLKNLLKLGGPR